MGILPYYTDHDYIDTWGLMDEHIAREGFDIDYILKKEPALFLIKEVSSTKAIRDDKDFKDEYTLLFTLELKEITQYLEEQEYDLWIYRHNSFKISNSSLKEIF